MTQTVFGIAKTVIQLWLQKNIRNFKRQVYEEFHTNKFENMYKMDNFLRKYNLTTQNQEDKTLTRTEPVKRIPKLKSHPQKPSRWPRHF